MPWLTKSLVCVFSNHYILKKKAKKIKCIDDVGNKSTSSRQKVLCVFISEHRLFSFFVETDNGCRKCMVFLILFSTALISLIHLLHRHTIIFSLTRIPSRDRLGNSQKRHVREASALLKNGLLTLLQMWQSFLEAFSWSANKTKPLSLEQCRITAAQ